MASFNASSSSSSTPFASSSSASSRISPRLNSSPRFGSTLRFEQQVDDEDHHVVGRASLDVKAWPSPSSSPAATLDPLPPSPRMATLGLGLLDHLDRPSPSPPLLAPRPFPATETPAARSTNPPGSSGSTRFTKPKHLPSSRRPPSIDAPLSRFPPPMSRSSTSVLALVASLFSTASSALPQSSPDPAYPPSPSLMRIPRPRVIGRRNGHRKALMWLTVVVATVVLYWTTLGGGANQPGNKIVEAVGPPKGGKPVEVVAPLPPAPPPPVAIVAAAVSPKEQAKLDAVAAKEKKKLDSIKKRKAEKYKHLLQLGTPSRRHLYGANFQPTEEDEAEVVGAEGATTNKKLVHAKVPSKQELKKQWEEDKERFEADREHWETYEWDAPKVHKSLEKLVKKLDHDELALRSWIRELHNQPLGRAVGLSALNASPRPSVTPMGLPPDVTGGSVVKWEELHAEASSVAKGLGAGKCEGNTWLKTYKKMHHEMLTGVRPPKLISYHCEDGMNCGGLGDRLLGMTSAFFFGLMTNRAFLAEWQTPIPVDVVFDSPHLDWSYSSFTPTPEPLSAALPSADLDVIHFDRLAVDLTFGGASWNPKKDRALTKGFEKRDLAYQSRWIKFFSNRGMILRSFAFAHLKQRIEKYGLQPLTAFACISDYLFRPKPVAMDLISEYTSVVSLPTVFSVGIQIRTGDLSMKDAEYDKLNTVERHRPFFRCARELASTYALPTQRIVYYLVTDSLSLKVDAQRVFGSKLIVTDSVPQHVHQKGGHEDGVFNAVVENWILKKTDMRVVTQDSGFGKLAAFASGKESTTVSIFPRFNEDVNKLQSKKSHMKVDCTNPSSLASFEEMASEWSLG